MTGSPVRYSESPPGDWDATCRREAALFGSVAWQSLLAQGFGCRTIYGCTATSGLAISVFHAGPFKLGYLGFPVGGMVGKEPVEVDQLAALRASNGIAKPDVIRIPVSPFGAGLVGDLSYESSPETAIEDLQSWTVAATSSNVRRDVARAERCGIRISDASDPLDGSRVYRIYRDTIRRHGGPIRYTEPYFEALVAMSKIRPDLRVLLAHQDAEFAGFNVVATHGTTGYYLHGGFVPELRPSRPAAALMRTAIEWTRSRGCATFNFLSSPPKQPQLVQYKEKWGGTTREHRTYMLPIRPTYHLFRIAERIYRHLN